MPGQNPFCYFLLFCSYILLKHLHRKNKNQKTTNYNVDGRLHRAWLLRQDSCPLGVLWNYYGDAGRGDTQEEMDAYNEFNTYGELMDNTVAPWFANGDDENGGPDASTYFMG